MKIFNSLVLLVVALFAFGCSTAVVDAEGDDATVGVDAQSAGTDTTNNADAADAQTGTDSDTQSNADATQPKPDTTTSADAHKVDSGTDSQNTTPDAHHSAPDAAGDTKDVGNDTGSNADAAKNDVDAANNGSTDASSIDANKPDSSVDSGADASNGADSVDTGANIPACVPTAEVCDGIDNDCDGLTDEGPIDPKNPGGPAMPYYKDVDGDGYGNSATAILMCSGNKTPGYTDMGNDCNDSDPNVHPNATELCDNIDNNCDSATDTLLGQENTKCVAEGKCYAAHKDKLGQACTGNYGVCAVGGVLECATGTTNLICSTDVNGSASKATQEVCGDNLDNDCDGQSDENCQVCDAVACGNLGGSCVANVCKTFCDTCGAYSACEDSNLDGLGDKCTAIPSALVQANYSYLDNAIVTILPNIPANSNFYGIFFRTYKTLTEQSAGWFNYPQWQLNSNFYVMPLYDELPANAVQSAKSSGFNDPDVCGVRFNADISTSSNGPVNHWLCEGNGATAHVLDPGARFFRLKNTVLIEITKFVKPWSAPGSTLADGCAMKLETKATCPQN